MLKKLTHVMKFFFIRKLIVLPLSREPFKPLINCFLYSSDKRKESTCMNTNAAGYYLSAFYSFTTAEDEKISYTC